MRGYRGRRALVTGAAGFIGSRLCAALEAAGARVTRLDLRAGQTVLKCDLRSPVAALAAVRRAKPDFVFHLAALMDRDSSSELLRPMIETNVFGTYNLFEALRKAAVPKAVVLAGSCEEYGHADSPFREDRREDPVGPYSFSKTCAAGLARLYSRLYGLPTVVLRPTLAYGPGQPPTMFLPALIAALKNGKPFEMTRGGQTRDFIYIDDLVEAFLKAGLAPKAAGRVINIGSGKPCTIRRAALAAAKLMGRQDLLRIGARPYRPAEIMAYHADISQARRLLGWQPKTGLEEGLRRTLGA